MVKTVVAYRRGNLCQQAMMVAESLYKGWMGGGSEGGVWYSEISEGAIF